MTYGILFIKLTNKALGIKWTCINDMCIILHEISQIDILENEAVKVDLYTCARLCCDLTCYVLENFNACTCILYVNMFLFHINRTVHYLFHEEVVGAYHNS